MKQTRKPLARALLAGSTGAALFTGAGSAVQAQDMIQPSLTVPSLEAAENVLAADTRTGLFKLGIFNFYPRIGGSVYFDDNIDIQNTDTKSDVIWTITPGLSAVAAENDPEGGRVFRMDYAPSFVFFSDHRDNNSINQSGSVNGIWPFAKLTLGFNQSFSAGSQPQADIGGRADEFQSLTALTSRYILGEKTSIEVNVGMDLQDYGGESYSSSMDWSNTDWFNYQVGPKLTLGAGATFGYVSIENGPDQSYQQLRVRGIYALAEKINLSASAGAEGRQYRSDVSSTIDPVWDLGASYQPWDSSIFQVTLYQRYSSSAVSGNQNYLATGLALGWQQRIIDRLHLDTSLSYSHSDYRATQVGVTVSRRDDLFRFRTALNFQIKEKWTAGVFYAFETDQSNQDVYTYTRNQVGLESAWAF